MKEYFSLVFAKLKEVGAFVRGILFITVVYCFASHEAIIGLAIFILWIWLEGLSVQIDEIKFNKGESDE